jgi:hypothetical protein
LFLEIDDGEDENIEHDDAFLHKLKGKVSICRLLFPVIRSYSVAIKVPDHEMAGDGVGDDNNEDDGDDSDFDIDETDLESYSTVLEANEDIDEFQIFSHSLQRE